MAAKVGHWIGGSEVHEGPTIPVIDPASGSSLGEVHVADADVVARAVTDAERAARGWAATPLAERGEILERVAELLSERVEEFAQLDTLDVGMPIRLSRAMAGATPGMTRASAGAIDGIRGVTTPAEDGRYAFTLREPYGVVGSVIPWNYPFAQAVHSVMPPLIAGNAVVLKPAELTPLSALELARLCTEAGLPDGVLNLVNGPGPTTGEALVRDARVGLVCFTGSPASGRAVQAAAAEGIARPVILELGGKDAVLVHDDADVAAAVERIRVSVFNHAGQTCAAKTRVIVHHAVADEVVDRLHAAIASLRTGDPNDPETDVGPVASERQLLRVEGYVDRAREQGARVAIGGERLVVPGRSGGFFYRPTMVTDVTPEHTIFHEEVFGPVLTVTTAADDAEMVGLANLPAYGLEASVWTRDLVRGLRAAAALEAGAIHINGIHLSSGGIGRSPWKGSGYDADGGLEGVLNMTRSRTVILQTSRSEGRSTPG
jgi:acyl-CoA reductase-like NAD-dependent aldehyde dehydrogenase